MEEFNVIIVSLLSSFFTLVLKAFLDYLLEGRKNRSELRKLMFERKTNAVENAMSWYQEAIDCFSLMQLACKELMKDFNVMDYSRYLLATQKAQKLSEGTARNLNPLYLYYDVSQIEQKHEAIYSLLYMSSIQKEIYKLDQKAKELSEKEYTSDSIEIKEMMNQGKVLFEGLHEALDAQIKSMIDIQKRLRQEYKSFSFKEDKITWWHWKKKSGNFAN